MVLNKFLTRTGILLCQPGVVSVTQTKELRSCKDVFWLQAKGKGLVHSGQ